MLWMRRDRPAAMARMRELTVRVRAIDPFDDPEENRPPIFNARNFAPRLPISA